MFREGLTAVICYDVHAVLRIYQDVRMWTLRMRSSALLQRNAWWESVSFLPQGRKQVGVYLGL